jgi:HK97 family phage prohead protease
MRETKDFKFSVIGETSDEGEFTGHASVFGGIDSYQDTVEPGAFKKTLKENKSFPLLWSHNTAEPIGIITGEEDKKGLATIGSLNMDVASAREKRSLVKQGAIRGMSIGYEAVKWEFDNVEKVRHLKEIKLWEISLVVFPADRAAQVARIKGVPYSDFGGLMDLLNDLDIKEIDERFQDAAKRAADRIYALLKVQEPLASTPESVEPLTEQQPSLDSLFSALDRLNSTLTGGK